MRHNSLILLAVVALCPLGVRAADTVCLRDGRKVEGKVERLAEDRLVIRTAAGAEEYTREQVKWYEVEARGPDGKPVAVRGTFKLKMPFEVETEHYVTKTDIAEHVAKNAASAMEELYKAYSAIFNLKAAPPKEKTELIIFNSHDDFDGYVTDVTGSKPRPETLGFYRSSSTGGAQIVAYKRTGDEFNTLSTLYHEATHEFVMLVMEGRKPPLWVNEGLAVYFENSYWQKDRLRTGVIPEKRLLAVQQRIRAGKHVALKDLLTRGSETFDGLCESEAWSLVYFFVKANDGAYAKRFVDYFRMLREEKKPDEAFKECFPADLDKLEAVWKKFVLDLKATPKK